MRLLLSLWLVCSLIPLFGQQQTELRTISSALPSTQIKRQLRTPETGASYVVIVPHRFLPAVLPLARVRQQLGQTVACVTLEVLSKEFPGRREQSIQQFLREACSHWPQPRPRFVLLAADVRTETAEVPAIPTWYVNDYQGHSIASDYPYTKGDGELNTLLVGRLPARTMRELQAMADKIVEYEQRQHPGLWQRRISLFAGPGGYGPVADLLLENIASSLLADNIPAGYQVTMSYASPSSPYFFPADRFTELVMSRFQEGALFTVYIGHGNKDRFVPFSYKSSWYSFFGVADARKLEIANGFPIMVSLSCLNGCYDDAKDCLGEVLLKQRRGPVAFIGASRVSHPYGNVLLGQELLSAIFSERLTTVGDTLARARRGLVHPPLLDVGRYLLEQSVAYFGDKELPFAEVRLDHAYMYNLLGDPATRIFFPDFSLAFTVTAQQDGWLLCGNEPRLADCRELAASVEVAADRLVPRKTAAAESSLEQKYWQANDKVIVGQTLKNPGRAWQIVLTAPALPAGTYCIKVVAVTATGVLAGWHSVEVKRKQE